MVECVGGVIVQDYIVIKLHGATQAHEQIHVPLAESEYHVCVVLALVSCSLILF